MRRLAAWLILVFSLLGLLVLSLFLGSLGASPPTGLRGLVLRIRLMRALLAVGIGGVLGIAGLFTQYAVSNPLASPDILGVLQGAYVASMLVVILYHGSPPLGLPLVAGVVGGLLAYLASVALAARIGLTRTGLVLAGIAVASLLAGLSSLLTLLAEALAGISAALLLLGTFAYATWDSVLLSLLGLVVGTIIALFLSRGLDALSYGDDVAASLGYSPGFVRLVATATAAALSAVSVYAAGIIYFVSLIAPNAARLLVGGHPARSIPATILLGAIISLGADIVARSISIALHMGEVPGGLVTAITGGVFLAYLLIRMEAGLGQ